MNDTLLREELQSILDGIAPGAQLGSVSPGENLREGLDIDSFDFLRLVQGIEGRLGVSIPETDYPRLVSLSDLLAYLSERTR